MRMNIEKIIMILNKHSFKIKNSMVMYIFTYVNIQLLMQQGISLALHICNNCLSISILFNLKKPYINISTWTMFWDRIVKA